MAVASVARQSQAATSGGHQYDGVRCAQKSARAKKQLQHNIGPWRGRCANHSDVAFKPRCSRCPEAAEEDPSGATSERAFLVAYSHTRPTAAHNTAHTPSASAASRAALPPPLPTQASICSALSVACGVAVAAAASSAVADSFAEGLGASVGALVLESGEAATTIGDAVVSVSFALASCVADFVRDSIGESVGVGDRDVGDDVSAIVVAVGALDSCEDICTFVSDSTIPLDGLSVVEPGEDIADGVAAGEAVATPSAVIACVADCVGDVVGASVGDSDDSTNECIATCISDSFGATINETIPGAPSCPSGGDQIGVLARSAAADVKWWAPPPFWRSTRPTTGREAEPRSTLRATSLAIKPLKATGGSLDNDHMDLSGDTAAAPPPHQSGRPTDGRWEPSRSAQAPGRATSHDTQAADLIKMNQQACRRAPPMADFASERMPIHSARSASVMARAHRFAARAVM